VAVKLADRDERLSRPPAEHFAPCLDALGSFRAAVGDLVAEVADCTSTDVLCAERVISRRVWDSDLAQVLEATPDGFDATVSKMLFEIRNYEPNPSNSIASLASLVRISLLAQIDAVWWGRSPMYETDEDVRQAPDLVDLDELDDAGKLLFRYRHQAVTLVHRAARSAQRRALPGHAPRTAGLWMPRAQPQVVTWLNGLAEEFARIAPDGTPPLWITSVARSIEHQRHLKSLGYLAPLPSSHCNGYAADIEMKWYRRFRAHRLLRGLLLDRQRADEVNVIDEGQAWHVCLRPDSGTEPQSEPAADQEPLPEPESLPEPEPVPVPEAREGD
jgi:hypothetical protein